MCRSSSASVDQPGEVNMTAEEDVEDDDDIPDISTFRASAEEPHVCAAHAGGTADLSSALSLSGCLNDETMPTVFCR